MRYLCLKDKFACLGIYSSLLQLHLLVLQLLTLLFTTVVRFARIAMFSTEAYVCWLIVPARPRYHGAAHQPARNASGRHYSVWRESGGK